MNVCIEKIDIIMPFPAFSSLIQTTTKCYEDSTVCMKHKK